MEEKTIQNISQMIEQVDRLKLPVFDEHFQKRNSEIEVDFANQNDLLRRLAILVAYSQQAQSESVKNAIKSGAFDSAFIQFKQSEVSKLNPCDVVDEHWQNIKGIRQQTKAFQIVMLARKIPHISSLLKNFSAPKRISCSDELDKFWAEFKILKKTLRDSSVPFFRETTSLLHLLTDLGYDCIKPDSAVLKAARKLGFLSVENPKDKDLVQVVKAIQNYSIYTQRIKSPPVLDLYLLVHGGQTEAANFVSSAYYKNT